MTPGLPSSSDLKSKFEYENKKRKKEFKKRYEYYLKIKKGLKMLSNKIKDLSKQINSSNKMKFEVEKDKYKYTVCIIKQDSEDGVDSVTYKMYKQRRPDGANLVNSDSNQLKVLEVIGKIEKLKDKYKRLKQLKVKNDDKLIKAKQAVEDLKKKNGAELIEELDLLPKNKSDKLEDLLSKKRDQAMNGTFKLPKMKNKSNKMIKNRDNNISTVHEIEEEEIKSSGSSSNTNLNTTRMTVTPEKGGILLTQDNLNKLSLKNERTKIQSSLVGGLLKTINPANGTQSQIDMRPGGDSSINCGKMFMLNERMSFIGTSSMLGPSFSTINSLLSSNNETQSHIFSDISGNFSANESRNSLLTPNQNMSSIDLSRLCKNSPDNEE